MQNRVFFVTRGEALSLRLSPAEELHRSDPLFAQLAAFVGDDVGGPAGAPVISVGGVAGAPTMVTAMMTLTAPSLR